MFDGELLERYPMLMERAQEFIRDFSDALPSLAHLPGPNPEGRRIVSLVDERRLRRILAVMLDEDEFLGPHGIRAISRRHLDQPCIFDWGGQEYNVHYLPAESDTGMFGGNSNWRGPVWFPMNVVILRGLAQLHRYYGDRLKVECPTGSGHEMNLLEVATEIATRLATTFTDDEHGRRPVFGGIEKFQTDPHWHDLILFHEYFHGDNGAGIGGRAAEAIRRLVEKALAAQPSFATYQFASSSSLRMSNCALSRSWAVSESAPPATRVRTGRMPHTASTSPATPRMLRALRSTSPNSSGMPRVTMMRAVRPVSSRFGRRPGLRPTKQSPAA